MNISSVAKKLGRFRSLTDNKGAMIYMSRVTYSYTKDDNYGGLDRIVKVINQGGVAVALPIVLEKDGTERVAFHAKTIKSLVEFLEGDKKEPEARHCAECSRAMTELKDVCHECEARG